LISTIFQRASTCLPVLVAMVASICLVAVRPLAAAELFRLIDSPTAGLVSKGRFGIDLRLFPHGGLVAAIQAGALERLTIGLAFGGEQIIGDQPIEWYPRVEAGIRYRLIEESTVFPAAVIGYETQGYGSHQNKRYQIKSKGLFVALSKNYASGFGQFGVHGGLNLSREDEDGDEDLSSWVGLDKSINDELVVVAEYDFAFNDNSRQSLGSGDGYLNGGVRWSIVPQLTLGLYLKNLLTTGVRGTDLSRELSVLYTEGF
jgi:hypothetical protein